MGHGWKDTRALGRYIRSEAPQDVEFTLRCSLLEAPRGPRGAVQTLEVLELPKGLLRRVFLRPARRASEGGDVRPGAEDEPGGIRTCFVECTKRVGETFRRNLVRT